MSARDFMASRRLAEALRDLIEASEPIATGEVAEEDFADLYEAVEVARCALTDYELEIVRPSKAARAELANIIVDCDRILHQEPTR